MRLHLAVPLLAVVAVSCVAPTPPPPEDAVECTDCTPPPADAGEESSNVASGMPCEVAEVLSAKCISCHGATPTGGAPSSLMTRDDLLRPSVQGGTIAARCVVRVKDPVASMPPAYAGEALTPTQIAALENWVDAGLPGGACLSAGAAVPAGPAYCRPCSTGADCGGSANFCLGTFCGVDCSDDPTCGENQRCANIIDSATRVVVGRNCVPNVGHTCAGPDPIVPDAGMVVGGTDAGMVVGGADAGMVVGMDAGAVGGVDAGTVGGVDAGSSGGMDAGVACTPDTWTNYGASFFATTCSGCHPGYSTQSDVIGNRSGITSRINSGNMPQGSTLSAAQKTRILRYLNCGAP